MDQPQKVSMIMPCYNKARFLDVMLESIANQVYGNIELIAVDDASTDDTSKVLRSWERCFEKRGYTLKIISRDVNGGPTAAINTGLKFIEGEYVCFPDADDWLHPEFVSALVRGLEDNPDYGWSKCDGIAVRREEPEKIISRNRQTKKGSTPFERVMRIVLWLDPITAWLIMVRTDFLKNAVPNLEFVYVRVTQEYSIQLPLTYLGDYVHVPRALYKYFTLNDGSACSEHFKSHDSYFALFDKFLEARKRVLDALPATPEEKFRWGIASLAQDYSQRIWYLMENGHKNEAKRHLSDLMKLLREVRKDINEPKNFDIELYYVKFVSLAKNIVAEIALECCVVGPKWDTLCSAPFVLYGAGKNCGRILPFFMDQRILPAEIWDINAKEGQNMLGIPVKKAHRDYITDAVIVMTIADEATAASACDAMRDLGYKNFITGGELELVLEYAMCKRYFPCVLEGIS
ncbi:MAG: glycosyltransferase family 2 protein [Prevotellaceae bacterium]|jgi:glycosyltransferase involved in cell wall biosynthesis|nr:glycosyltransferase family 2 protein [Prevotellaceae bacterium]